jgi:FkbM family methyltransferase
MFFSSCIRSILNPKFVDNIKRTLGFASLDVDYELSKISRLGRFKTGETNLILPYFRFVDSESFINQFIEIFRNDILFFKTDKANPMIVDCGSNVGVSVCYFKHIFPTSRIIAFEPDSEIFSVLEQNTRCFDPSEIEIHNKAVWTEEKKLSFQPDGADGGRLLNQGKKSVTAVKLSDYLHTEINMLKIDIEGAEKFVLPSIAENLKNVEHLFLELHVEEKEPELLEHTCQLLREQGFRFKLDTIGSVNFQSFHDPDTYSMQINIYAVNENFRSF